MTNLSICGLLIFAPAQSRKGSALGRLSLLKMVCIVLLFCTAAAMVSPAQSVVVSTLANFDGTNGRFPRGVSLVHGIDGNFYGTTESGGANNNGTFCSGGCGTVFKITPGGTLTTLYSFCAQTDCTDGATPLGGVVQASDGNFYGTTTNGGAGNCDMPCGTVFKITPGGTLTTLHSFSGMDGANPFGGVVQASDGNFYGTAFNGGPNNNCNNGCGTVFKITPVGTLTTLYSFCTQINCPDGANPYVGVLQANDGNFYGTTYQGGQAA